MDRPLDQDCPPAPVPDGAEARELPIINRRGLHARASAKFVQTVERFDAEVTVTRCGETVAAAQGTTITVTAKGNDAMACLQAIGDLLANRFGEEE